MILNRTFRKVRSLLYPRGSFILGYHLIGSMPSDPLRVSVTVDNFYDHMAFLNETYDIVSIKELLFRKKEMKKSRQLIALTFDDGYTETIDHAIPILEKFKAPATFFVIPKGFHSLCEVFRAEDAFLQYQKKILLPQEIKALAKHPLVEIGSHGLTHTRFSIMQPQVQEYEIKESKKILENLIKKPIDGFAYPYGASSDFTNFTKKTVSVYYQYACTAVHRRMYAGTHHLALPRIFVPSVNAHALRVLLEKY